MEESSSTSDWNGTMVNLNETQPEMEYTPPSWKLFIMYTMALLILIVNLPVFLIVPKKVPSLQRSMRYTMLSLAMTDFLLGCECLLRLFLMSKDYTLESGSPLCRWDGFMNNLLASVSILSLTWLSVDKLLIVRYPMTHKEIITKKKIILILALIWLAMLVLYVPGMIDKTGTANFDEDSYICIGAAGNMIHALIIVSLVHIIPSTTIFFCFIAIYILIRKSQAFRRKASTSTYSNENGQRSQQENLRMIKTLFIMSSGYFIMWVPFFVTVPYWEIFNGQSLHPVSDFVTSWLGAANSMLNALVYIPTLKPYRQALFLLLRLRKSSPITSQGSGESRSVIVMYAKGETMEDPFSSNSH